jgi:hypothetical protein
MEVEGASPPAVALLVILILVVFQPISGELGGVGLNWIAVAIVIVGGLMGLLQ